MKAKYRRRGWIGFDLDGCLASYTGWIGFSRIGEPIPRVVDAMVNYARKGWEVRVLTARVAPDSEKDDIPVQARRRYIKQWLKEYVQPHLPKGYPEVKVTHQKDKYLYEMWDDRAVQVLSNTGLRVDKLLEEVCSLIVTEELPRMLVGSKLEMVSKEEYLRRFANQILLQLKADDKSLPSKKAKKAARAGKLFAKGYCYPYCV